VTGEGDCGKRRELRNRDQSAGLGKPCPFKPEAFCLHFLSLRASGQRNKQLSLEDILSLKVIFLKEMTTVATSLRGQGCFPMFSVPPVSPALHQCSLPLLNFFYPPSTSQIFFLSLLFLCWIRRVINYQNSFLRRHE
jgi:hypothetical protein